MNLNLSSNSIFALAILVSIPIRDLMNLNLYGDKSSQWLSDLFQSLLGI